MTSDLAKPVAKPDRVFCCVFGDRFRYFVLLLSWFCLTSISSNMFTFNFSIICMSPGKNQSAHNPTYSFSTAQQTYLMWALGVGSLAGTFPFTYAFSRFGTRHIFTAAGLLSIGATALTPLAISAGMETFLGVRFLQGVAYAADFAAIGMLTSRWASLKQHALFISLLTCYSPLSSTLTFVASGYICESSLGWPFIYYTHAVAGSILFLLWFCTYTDHPRRSPWVSAVELEKIERGKNEEQLAIHNSVPYFKICTNPVVLAIWYNAFMEISSALFLVTYTPLYMRNVHGLGIATTGLISSAAPFVSIPLRTAFGLFSDKFKLWDEHTKINVFNTFAVLGPAVVYVAVILSTDRLATILLICLTHVFYASSGGGFYKCATLCCRQYSHFVIANIQFIKCLTLFFAPALYGFFVEDESSARQWNHIFLTICVGQTTAAVMFVFLSSAEPLPFTFNQGDQSAAKLDQLHQLDQDNVKKHSRMADVVDEVSHRLAEASSMAKLEDQQPK